jgi:hypothetical protein
MRPLYFLALSLAVVGCAKAEFREGAGVDSGVGGEDPDASTSGGDDSGGQVPDDAPTSTGSDSGTGGCTVMTRDLLMNPSFEGTPVGTGWTAVPIVTDDPLVSDTSGGGIAAQSPTMRAWLGGVAQANATDQLYQDVMVPPSTTSLVLTGFYEVRTGESGSTVYDTGRAEIRTTGGTSIETIKALDNAHATTAWTALDHTFTNLAQMTGQTVRVYFTSTNDGLYATSFYFDTLHLNATYCE